ncbi:MAG: c-type cytochrome [Planctomycetes bacterium]|nr:c-type cytochrome [Planctomycetota bacterium]
MSNENLREHTFDGIQEFDNRLPNWWLWTFYLACIFSIAYWVHYHTLGTGELPIEAYTIEQQVAAARLEAELAKNPVTDELLLKLAKEPAVVAEGAKIFKDPGKCALCHKPDASGLVGPNLTDAYWIYGNKPMDIYTTIRDGRPGGMLAHKDQGPLFIQRATAYVLSIMNTNVPGKPPEPNAKKQ